MTIDEAYTLVNARRNLAILEEKARRGTILTGGNSQWLNDYDEDTDDGVS